MKQVEWFCPKCKEFDSNPSPSGVSMVGVVAQMSCSRCGNWLMRLEKEDGK